MGVEPSIAGATLRPLVDYLESRGVDLSKVLRRRGIGSNDGALPDRIPVTQLGGIWDEAAAVAGDDSLGLHAAEALAQSPSSYGVFSYLAVSSPTWGHALTRVCQYFRLLGDVSTYQMEHVADDVLFCTRSFERPLDQRHREEFMIAVVVCFGRKHVAGDWMPMEVLFRHEKPPDIREHERIFGAAVRFEAPLDGFRFGRERLDTPLERADPSLSHVLEGYASDLLGRLPPHEDGIERLRHEARSALSRGESSLGALAERLGTSPRTLQRRLVELGTSHQRLIDSVRREMAEVLLGRPDVPLAEVAFILGFSEPAAFHRAFRRWTGKTPGQYRSDVALRG